MSTPRNRKSRQTVGANTGSKRSSTTSAKTRKRRAGTGAKTTITASGKKRQMATPKGSAGTRKKYQRGGSVSKPPKKDTSKGSEGRYTQIGSKSDMKRTALKTANSKNFRKMTPTRYKQNMLNVKKRRAANKKR